MRKAMVVLFALALVFALSSTSNAQNNTATGLYQVDVVSGLTVTITDGSINALSAGQTYTVSPDINNPNPIAPIVNGGEAVGSLLQIAVAASGSLTFELTLDLPHTLVGAVNTMPCSFATNSMYREEDFSLSNPNVPNVFSMGNGGGNVVTLDLGITVAVPANALDGDVYTGYVTATASVLGL
jgi:hypothetical protein